MILSIQPELVPLETDRDGVVRVGGSRVTLDTIVGAFLMGATADEIVRQYPTVDLGDVHSVLGYYLRHRESVDAYLASRRETADRVRREYEAEFPPESIRARLLARNR